MLGSKTISIFFFLITCNNKFWKWAKAVYKFHFQKRQPRKTLFILSVSLSLLLSLFLSLWVPRFRSIHKFRREMFGWLLYMRMSWPRRYADYSGHRWATNENSYNKSLDWVIFVLIFSYSWQLYGSYVSPLHFSYFHLQHLNICCFLIFFPSVSLSCFLLSLYVCLGQYFFLHLCMGFFLLLLLLVFHLFIHRSFFCCFGFCSRGLNIDVSFHTFVFSISFSHLLLYIVAVTMGFLQMNARQAFKRESRNIYVYIHIQKK